MTDVEVIAVIRRSHLKANIGHLELDPNAVIHWDRACVDPGGSIFGPGPYLKVPVTLGDEFVVRVYPPELLRRRLAKGWRASGLTNFRTRKEGIRREPGARPHRTS